MIPVFEPVLNEEDIQAVVAALRRGEISGSFGEALRDFETEFAAYVGCKHGIATSSGTTALHLAVAAAKIGTGDEVLMSTSTNIATALLARRSMQPSGSTSTAAPSWAVLPVRWAAPSAPYQAVLQAPLAEQPRAAAGRGMSQVPPSSS